MYFKLMSFHLNTKIILPNTRHIISRDMGMLEVFTSVIVIFSINIQKLTDNLAI